MPPQFSFSIINNAKQISQYELVWIKSILLQLDPEFVKEVIIIVIVIHRPMHFMVYQTNLHDSASTDSLFPSLG